MKRNQLPVLLFLFLLPVTEACKSKAKKEVTKPVPKSNYVFSDIKDITALPVIDQNASGTCWSFSTTSFLESEIIRLKGEKIDLSEMYFVRCAYLLKARNYILRQGTARFTEGGLNHDPLITAAAFGMLPQQEYTGLKEGKTRHNHFKMFNELDTAVKRYANPANKAGTGWKKEIPEILDRFLGKVPEQFQYNGQTYTSQSFLAYTRLNPGDYLTITSFSDAPFYKLFQLSIPANWANERFYNLPLDEFMENIDHAVDAGFSLALDLDATEPTFAPDQGIAVLPEKQEDNTLILTDIRPEKKVTQQMRQDAFESFETTDDHLMHIVGKAKDQHGNIYYKTKNSWGTGSSRQGFVYLSVPYMKMKGISVLLHKDGLMEATKHKLWKDPETPY
ncbi:C1 family peptidase [Chitinophaga polysaccharea]|uniref:C1 family peptidase n=1 Tax=Chitinophaga polysaccharea TaxID=1293035 RepID=UPI0011594D3A|nr:C1 family peptidase [Chitinophaga polysaccharea]